MLASTQILPHISTIKHVNIQCKSQSQQARDSDTDSVSVINIVKSPVRAAHCSYSEAQLQFFQTIATYPKCSSISMLLVVGDTLNVWELYTFQKCQVSLINLNILKLHYLDAVKN